MLRKYVTKSHVKKQNISQVEATCQALKRLCQDLPHYTPDQLALLYQRQLEYD